MAQFDLKKFLLENRSSSAIELAKQQLRENNEEDIWFTPAQKHARKSIIQWIEKHPNTKGRKPEDLDHAFEEIINGWLDSYEYKEGYKKALADRNSKIVFWKAVRLDSQGKLNESKQGQYFGPDGDAIIEIIKDRAKNNDSSDIDEAMEIMEFIGQHFGIDFEFGAGPSRLAEAEDEKEDAEQGEEEGEEAASADLDAAKQALSAILNNPDAIKDINKLRAATQAIDQKEIIELVAQFLSYLATTSNYGRITSSDAQRAAALAQAGADARASLDESKSFDLYKFIADNKKKNLL